MEKELVSGIPKLWKGATIPIIFCPGCHHGVVQRVLCEVIEEMGIEGKTIGVWGIGCSPVGVATIMLDAVQLPHGRPPDGATGIKRVLPDSLVFTLQGDGDCIAIGTEALIQAAARGEKITVIMVNNTTYGTTGGQLAPTTLMGQITATTPTGRDERAGYPIQVENLLTPLKGVAYCARGTVHTPANYHRTKGYLKTAFQKQLDNVGFSFVEILSACPVNWHLSPLESLKWIEEKMIPQFPLGEFKNIDRID